MASARFAYSISLNQEQETELRKVLNTDGNIKVIDVFMAGVKYLMDGVDNKRE